MPNPHYHHTPLNIPRYISPSVQVRSIGQPVVQLTRKHFLILACRQDPTTSAPWQALAIVPYQFNPRSISSVQPAFDGVGIHRKPSGDEFPVSYHFRESHNNLLLLAVYKFGRTEGMEGVGHVLLEFRHLGSPDAKTIQLHSMNALKSSTTTVRANEIFGAVLSRHRDPDASLAVLSIVTLREQRVFQALTIHPRRLSTFTFLGGTDPFFLSSNPESFCLDIWRITREKIIQTATLELPALNTRFVQCGCLKIAPLDCADPEIYNGDPTIMIECSIEKRSPKFECRENTLTFFVILVKLKFLENVYKRTAHLQGPQLILWREWSQHAMIYDLADLETLWNLQSGHTFTVGSRRTPSVAGKPHGLEYSYPDVHTSVWNLRGLQPPQPTPFSCRLKRFNIENIFREGLPLVSHLSNCHPHYRALLPHQTYASGYEGLIGQIDPEIWTYHFLYTPFFHKTPSRDYELDPPPPYRA
ncbi:hypothetical protein H0H93_010460 [Arthromyces matolae]|nr:hypothetical protein H0H93_010460 [Arthromyces matolae]